MTPRGIAYENKWAPAIKNTIYVEANIMNIYAKFRLHPPPSPLIASKKKIFEYSFRKFSFSVAMATNQNQRFQQNSYGW